MADFLKDCRGWTLVLKPYRRPREDWDHDHCICCGQAIAEPGVRPDAATIAYAVGNEHPRGADYEWLCPVCAVELAPRLNLRLVNAHE